MSDSQFDTLNSAIKEIKLLLTGNGSPEKGIIVRLDRVETKIKSATWFVRAAIVAAITAIGGLAVEIGIKLMP